MSDDTRPDETARSERYGNLVVVALSGLYAAAFVGFVAYFIYCAVTGF